METGSNDARDALRADLMDAGRGDRAAFGRFVDRSAPVVWGWLRGVRGTDRREAILVETYRRAWERAPGYSTASLGPLSWLAEHLENTIDPAH